jgi:hypothetical protein
MFNFEGTKTGQFFEISFFYKNWGTGWLCKFKKAQLYTNQQFFEKNK